MKMLISLLLAGAAGASFATAPTAALSLDAQTYRSLTDKAAGEFKVAMAKCDALAGNARTVCVEEAKAARAHAHADAIAQYKSSQEARTTARVAAANADFAVAKARCNDKAGADREQCLADAGSERTVATAEAKANRDSVSSPTAKRVGNAAESAVNKVENVAANVADKTEAAANKVASATGVAADKTGEVVSDSVITTKVKADLFKQPELKSTSVHVETVKGVVMLSGFVNSRADADKAVELARNTKGVTEVKSALLVK